MARLNGVEHLIETRRWCSSEALRALTSNARCFVLSDCEGYEFELFDEAAVAGLSKSDVLIEIHGSACATLRDRFSKTHDVQLFVSRDRSAADYPELACLAANGPRAVSEHRPHGQQWLFAESRILS